MSNPFDQDDSENEQIVEGFLCPICKADLKTPDRLTNHVQQEHAIEDQDLLKSFRDIFLTAKKKIRNLDETLEFTQSLDSTVKSAFSKSQPSQPSSSTTITNNTNPPLLQLGAVYQECGIDFSHFSYFKAVRAPRLERYATETNKLIIRLHKLVTDRPKDAVQRKQHEQMIVLWLDGKSVKLCPNCAKKFNLTRRQHHCRLCGSIMCNDCSQFLSIIDAFSLINPTISSANSEEQQAAEQMDSEDNTLRICEHCLHLLQNRKDMQDSQSYRPPITQYYDKIEQLKKDIWPDIPMYKKMIASLYAGDSIFTLADASALRGKIGHVAEKIDAYSKAILSLQYSQGSRDEALKKSIRLACVNYIKDEMLTLDPLPDEATLKELQRKRKQQTEQRIETERRLALQEMEKYEMLGNGKLQNVIHSSSTVKSATGSAVKTTDNWSGLHIDAHTKSGDPLVEQIIIIKGYLKQARDAMRFEEVETLELNLRELQQEFYNRQQQQS